MDSFDALFSLDGPTFYVVATSKDAFANMDLRLLIEYPNHCVRMVRGKKSRTLQAFYDEIAAALQFPYYFGENWPAFDDCISDLDWLVSDAYLLLVNDGDVLFADEAADERATFVRHIETGRESWKTPNRYIPRNRQPAPFHVLLQVEQAALSALHERIPGASLLKLAA